MNRRALREATYDDLLRVPDHMVAEIADGELFTSPRPAARHAHATARLATKLLPAFADDDGGEGDWWLLIEPELHFGRDVLVPDIAGWRRERMPRIPDVNAFTLAPDWVCEVISPSTSRLDRAYKVPIYARNGVAHGWIVDPIQRTVEVYRLQNGFWSVVETHVGDDVARIEPFEPADLRLATLWL